MEINDDGLTPEQKQTLKAIRHRKKEVVADHRSRKAVANNQAILPRKADRDRKSTTTNLKVSPDDANILSTSLTAALIIIHVLPKHACHFTTSVLWVSPSVVKLSRQA